MKISQIEAFLNINRSINMHFYLYLQIAETVGEELKKIISILPIGLNRSVSVKKKYNDLENCNEFLRNIQKNSL